MGFEIYYLSENKYSILGGTNRGKTVEEINENICTFEGLQKKLESIITHDGHPSYITIMHMGPYNLPNMKQEDINAIIDYGKSLGQRSTKYSPSYGKYMVFDPTTGKIADPVTNTELRIQVENTIVPKDPLSHLMRLMNIVDKINVK